MEVKVFEGLTMKEAIASVRKEFGVDAVILKTKEKKVDSGNGRKVFEVTAGRANLQGASSNSGSPDLFRSDIESLKEGIFQLQRSVRDVKEMSVSKENLFALESGIRELKMFVCDVVRDKENPLSEGLSPVAIKLIKKLQVMGIDEKYLVELADFMKNLPYEKSEKTEGSEEEYYQSNAIRWMLKRLKIAPRNLGTEGCMSGLVFVGSSGVGKSTIVAKLAARIAKKGKKKVKVIAYDNQNLAGYEQMRIYTKLLGIPFSACSGIDEINKQISDSSDTDLFLIDTSAKNARKSESDQGLQQLNDLNIPMDFHLVLSMTDRLEHMDRTVRSYMDIGLSSLIFNKLDESWAYGDIYNMVSNWSVPISFFGTGRNVPEDIEFATRERVIERIFGL